MAFESGHSKMGGRTKGVPNRTTIELRQVLRDILDQEIQRLPQYISELNDPKIKIVLIIKLMPFVFPKMQSIDLVDAKEKDHFDW